MQPQGWYRDPYGNHAERWFSDGKPTNLVRDYGTDSYDERPQDRLPPYPRDSRGRPETVPKWPDRLPLWQYAILYFCSWILSIAIVATIIQLTWHHPFLGIRWWVEYGVSSAIGYTGMAIWARAVRMRRRRRRLDNQVKTDRVTN